jgi:hypothetical protein
MSVGKAVIEKREAERQPIAWPPVLAGSSVAYLAGDRGD